MVMNLDKCIGCHTCSITCKNAWTNRKGTEYMYFNNVETRPGVGYPKGWEDQAKWLGGWELRDGRLQLRSGSALMRLLKLFYNPQQPEMDDYFEPWTYDYEELTNATRKKHQPVARPRSLVTGERMEITWGPNWDDDLAGTKYARQDLNLEEANKVGESIKMEMEDLFMRYLPRTCNHCLNPACVAACPSGAIYKRDEDGVVLVNQDQCRGWRILDRNWHCRYGELDIVARSEAGCITFVEVKTRRTLRYGTPQEAVTASKQINLRHAAVQWLMEPSHRVPHNGVRFDVITVIVRAGRPLVHHIEGAF